MDSPIAASSNATPPLHILQAQAGAFGSSNGGGGGGSLMTPKMQSLSSNTGPSTKPGLGAIASLKSPNQSDTNSSSQQHMDASKLLTTTTSTTTTTNTTNTTGGYTDSSSSESVHEYIQCLILNKDRDVALWELSKKREQIEDIAIVLWSSFGVMTVLLQEIVSVYPYLSPSTLTPNASNRVCNALALLQCVASHPVTRMSFLNSQIPLFLYPFLNTASTARPFEYLRLTSLGVIGALVKNESSQVINFLLTTEIIPLCLKIMDTTGLGLSKTVAIFIIQKILMDNVGLAYVCQTYERFYAIATVLSNMVSQLAETMAFRLLKHVVRCYLRLSENPRARQALRQCLPEPLRDGTFSQILKDDLNTKNCLAQLLINLSDVAIV